MCRRPHQRFMDTVKDEMQKDVRETVRTLKGAAKRRRRRRKRHTHLEFPNIWWNPFSLLAAQRFPCQELPHTLKTLHFPVCLIVNKVFSAVCEKNHFEHRFEHLFHKRSAHPSHTSVVLDLP